MVNQPEDENSSDESESDDDSDEGSWIDVSHSEDENENIEEEDEEEEEESNVDKKEEAKELAITKIFTDADFKKIEGELIKRKVTSSSRKRKAESTTTHELPEKSEVVRLKDIEMIYKKRKTDREARIESMQKGREGREKFGYKDGRHSLHCSKTNREKQKKKNFQMVRHKARGKIKKSFREKQLALRKHLTQQKKMK